MAEKNSIPYSEKGVKEQDEKLLQPFTYILQVPGKKIRAKLAHAMNYWLNIPIEKLQAVGDITQMLHNSSLLIDDIQDNSILRRGIPVAHAIYGVARTISAANYVLFIALERVIALNHPKATQVYTEQLLELHRGQGIEIYWRDNYICPSEPEYRFMTMKKTGGLFNLAVRLMQLFSECKEEFSDLTGILGLYFQIRDDYCNLCMQDYSENKSYCEDLSEGKFSFPIIHAIQSQPEDKQVMNIWIFNKYQVRQVRRGLSLPSLHYMPNEVILSHKSYYDHDILRQRTKDVNVKKYCITLLEKFGSFAYTRSVLKELDQSARDEIERLGGNPLLTAVLDELLNWTKIEDNDVLSSRENRHASDNSSMHT